jgi:hypothetical protein
MKIEASIPLLKVRFDKVCKNYLLRIIQMNKNHPIQIRVAEDFPPFSEEIKVDKLKYLNWNKKKSDQKIAQKLSSESEDSNFSDSYQHTRKRRRRKRRRKRKKKKYLTQLIRILAAIQDIIEVSLKIEAVD